MKVIINGNTFQDAGWNVDGGIGILTVETNESIAYILDKIGANNDIQVYDGDTLVSTWFNSGVKGVSCDAGTKTAWIMTIRFRVSILDTNTEEELQEGVNDSVDAIIELAELIDDMDEKLSEDSDTISKMQTDLEDAKNTLSDHSRNIEDAKDDIKKIMDDINVLNQDMTSVKSSVEAIEPMQKKITDAQESITDLQHGFSSIPSDLVARFTAIWENYNALADRVAELENKEAE